LILDTLNLLSKKMKRRDFITTTAGVAAGASILTNPVGAAIAPAAKKRLALVGVGDRGTSFWGKRIVDNYGDITEFVGLCDINPGRLELAKKNMGVNCPVFTDFDEMIAKTKPDMVIVTTVDSNHHDFIIRAMDMGVDVLTEKPLPPTKKRHRQLLMLKNEPAKK
jgi:predicted dehydrogenase